MKVHNHNEIEIEVNPYTMAIIGETKPDGYTQSRVLEYEHEFIIPKKPWAIIDKSCKYFGSSLKGRQEGTREVTGITHKSPIAIDPGNGIYMFPTNSPTKDTCCWLSHSYILKFESVEYEKTKITFSNNQEVTVNVSKGSFENQLNRTAQFRYLLTQRLQINKEC